MRVALAIRSLEQGGGAEHDVVNLSRGLKKAGHFPLVITAGGRLCQDLRDAGIDIELLPLTARGPMSLRRNAIRLADVLERYDIEVVNPQAVFPAVSTCWAARRLRRKGRLIPNVVTIHMLQRLTGWYYRLGAMTLNRVAEHVIVESQCERQRLQRHGMRRPVTVLYNCFPAGQIAEVRQTREEIRREMNWPEQAVVFLMPARMSTEKSHDVLLRALAQPNVRPLPVLCYLAGEGPTLESVKALAGKLEVADKVVFGGFRRDVPRLYKAADVFLLCSSRESLPLSIREGMAAGLPVLSTDVGGIVEAVEDGRSGILIPPGDPLALAAAIARLAGDAVMRRRMGQRGLEIHRRKFDYGRWIERTVEVMTQVRQEYMQRMS